MLSKRQYISVAFAIIIGLLVSGCAGNKMTVKTAMDTPVNTVNTSIPEHQLLDVGIHLFDPGLDDIEYDKDTIVFSDVRHAESRYFPVQIMHTLQTTAAWGAVRVLPSTAHITDVVVSGQIVQSDGETLTLAITVTDSSGQRWFTKEYSELASRYDYDPKAKMRKDPFQGIYNRLANDMLHYKQQLTEAHITQLRIISELRFAKEFAPSAYGDYVQTSNDGEYTIIRLPSDDDPMLQRIQRIRDRDYLFVDTVQDHYGAFAKEMQSPYREWRRMSYSETIALRELRSSARNQTIAGIVAMVGGIAAAGGSNGSARVAGQVGVAAGGYLIKSGLDKRSESQIHIEALRELGESLEADIAPRIVELEDRTVTLSGNVQSQYEQWRKLLHDIYQKETGL